MLGNFEFSASKVGMLLILILSVAIHEAFHAFVADRLGDNTARRLGRVTFKPWVHADLFMTVLLPAIFIFFNTGFIFGAGKPVPVDQSQLKRKDLDFALIALAGPLSNILQCLLFTGIFVVCFQTGVVEPRTMAYDLLGFAVNINILLAVFNLIPIPPLDGSRLLAYLLPRPLKRPFYALDRFAIVILLLLIFTRVFQTIMTYTYLPTWGWWRDLLYERWLIT